MQVDLIGIDDVKVGYLYLIRARNGRIGIYRGDGLFTLLRTKFEDVFLFDELHRDRGGTVAVFRELEKSPWENPMEEDVRTEAAQWLRDKMLEYRNE